MNRSGTPGSASRTAGRAFTRSILAGGLVVLGAMAAWRLPLETFPEPRNPSLGVTVGLASPLSPEVVTRRWVVPLESALRGLGEVKSILGHVEPQGAHLTAELEPGAPVEIKAARLAGPVALIRRTLPEGAFLKIDSASGTSGRVTAVVWFRGPDADDVVSEVAGRLERQPGINSTSTIGDWERWTRVSVPPWRPDAEALEDEIRGRLADRLEVHRLGRARYRGREVPLLFGPPPGWRVEDLPVPAADGVLALHGVANVERRLVPPNSVVRFNWARARALIVMREPSTSPLRADATLRAALAESRGSRARGFVSWSEAADLRDLLERGALALLLSSILLAAAGAWHVGRSGLWTGLAPLLGASGAANLLWLFRIGLNLSTLTAMLFGLTAAIPLALVRASASRNRFLAHGALLVCLAAVAPFVVDLAGGEIRWPLSAPARAFALTLAAALAALLLLPEAGWRRSAARRRAGAGTILRRSLRDPVTVLLIGVTGAYGIVVLAGGALGPEPRPMAQNPADLVVRLSLPRGSSQDETEHEAEKIERFMASRPSVAYQWSVIGPQAAFVYVELTPEGRRLDNRLRLERELRASVVTIAEVEVRAGDQPIAGAGSSSGVESAQSLSPAVDAKEALSYRFVVASSQLDSLREAYRRISRRLGALGVKASELTGWDRPNIELRLRPREGVAPGEWLPWVKRLSREASPPQPLVLSQATKSYISVGVGETWGPFRPPRLTDLLNTAATVGGEATGASLFRVDETLVLPRVARRDGRFVVPVTVRPTFLSTARRRDQLGEIETTLRDLPLPIGASVILPAAGAGGATFEDLVGWRLAGLAVLVLVCAATLRTGRLVAAPLAVLATLPAVLAPAPWISLTLEHSDALTVLALVAAACVTAAAAIELVAAIAGDLGSAGWGYSIYRGLRDHLGTRGIAVWVGLGALVPLAAVGDPLRLAWAVPAGALALGTLGGVAGHFVVLPAALAALSYARRWSFEDTRARRFPASWENAPASPRLEARNLVKTYRSGHTALAGLGFTLEAGITALLGPNGAGKTTLLRTLVGLLQPSRGQIRYLGIPVDRYNQASYRSKIGFLPQELNAYSGVTGEHFLELCAIEKGIGPAAKRRSEIERVLALVELTEHADRKVRSYSGGMRRRVGMAQALLDQPPLLIVDEPTAGMDLESRLQLRHTLQRVSQGRIVLVSTHLTSDVEALAERLLFLYRGRLRYDGSQSGFLAAARGHVSELVVEPREVEGLAARFRVTRRVHVPDGVEMRLLATGQTQVPGTPVEPTLEEAYLHHLERAEGTG